MVIEGVGHRTVTFPDEGDLKSLTPIVSNPTAPAILPPRQQIAPQIHLSDRLLHDLPDSAGQATEVGLQDPPLISPVLRHSTQTSQPTRALLDARESLATQSAARDAGEEWAEEESTPEALATTAFAFLTSTRKGDLDSPPRSYWEAMRQPELWVPAMEAELKVMEDKKVWDGGA